MPPPTTTRSYRPPSFGLLRQAEQLAAEFSERFQIVRRLEVRVLAEEQGVAAALEAGQVVQGDLGLRWNFKPTAVLPVPGGPFGSKRRRQRLAIDKHLEPARCPRRLPRRDPIAGADPDAIHAGRRKLCHGNGVADRIAQAVGQQIGRTHLVHELLVDDPAAAIVEVFRLQQKPISGRHRIGDSSWAEEDAAEGRNQKERSIAFHGFSPKASITRSEFACDVRGLRFAVAIWTPQQQPDKYEFRCGSSHCQGAALSVFPESIGCRDFAQLSRIGG